MVILCDRQISDIGNDKRKSWGFPRERGTGTAIAPLACRLGACGAGLRPRFQAALAGLPGASRATHDSPPPALRSAPPKSKGGPASPGPTGIRPSRWPAVRARRRSPRGVHRLPCSVASSTYLPEPLPKTLTIASSPLNADRQPGQRLRQVRRQTEDRGQIPQPEDFKTRGSI